jgi:hypothetical protein
MLEQKQATGQQINRVEAMNPDRSWYDLRGRVLECALAAGIVFAPITSIFVGQKEAFACGDNRESTAKVVEPTKEQNKLAEDMLIDPNSPHYVKSLVGKRND